MKLSILTAATVLALAVGGCGTTDTQRAATGAVAGGLVAGPVGAVAGATTGVLMDEGLVAGSCPGFAAIDADRDRYVSTREWGLFRDEVFETWDLNDDARISRAEYENCWRSSDSWALADNDGLWDDSFGFFDDDADGFLGANEFFGDDEFGMFDDDRDGLIEPFEWG